MNTQHLEDQLLSLIRSPDYIPIGLPEICARLRLNDKESRRLRNILQTFLQDGTVARVKHDKFCYSRDADLISGTIQFRPAGSALLRPDKSEGEDSEPLHIHAEETGLAMHGDHVLCRINHDRETPSRKKAQQGEKLLRGHVVRVLRRANTTLTGTLQRANTHHYIIPDDPRIVRNIIVPDPALSKLDPKPRLNDKVIVTLKDWLHRHMLPEGEITEILGKSHTPDAEFKALLHKYKLEPDFSEAVMREVEHVPAEVRPEDIGNRLDCRQLFTLTIDPDDAKDFDDALSIEETHRGDTRIGIHIADVSTYVRPGSPLDREAYRRGNSTYLVGTVIPMLPHALSNGICSLVEDRDRLTKSVFVTFAATGKIKHTEFANTVIRSNKRLTYKQAYAFLKSDSLEKIRQTPLPEAHQTGSTGRPLSDLSKRELHEIQHAIRLLWQLAARLRQRRMRQGSLDLDMPEVKIYVNKQGWADRMERIFHDESHQLVEEFMLLANETVCKALLESNTPLISRVHDKPDEDRLAELRQYLLDAGIQTGDLNNRREITRLLEKLHDHPQGYTHRIQFLRSLKQACYRVEKPGHYGLNKTFYTHFTSPIRRYADLSVHRVFDAWMQKRGTASAPRRQIPRYGAHNLEGIATHISTTERNSSDAERESTKIKLLEFFDRESRKKDKTRFTAIITDVRNHGLFVELTESLAFGLIRMSSLQDDIYQLSSDRTSIVGRRRQRRYSIGQEITVAVENVDRFKRQIDFYIPTRP